MGNRGGRTYYNPPVYQHVGPTDAEIQERIRKQNQQNARIAEQARQAQLLAERQAAQIERKRQQDERLARQNFARMEKLKFQQYLSSLKDLDLKAYIPKVGKGERHYAVVGPISSGKSTLLNSIFNLNEDAGIGETTKIAKAVYKNQLKKLVVWDVPGINKDFSIYDPKNLGFFASCDKIFVIYKDTPKRCDHVIKVLNQIKPSSLYLIRTQCDSWDPASQKTLAEEKTEDMKILQQWGINAKKYYQHSSYVFGFDNQLVKKQIST